MDRVELLQQRLAKAKAALREAKRREKEKEERRVFDLVRRSGLTLPELEKMLSATPAPATKNNSEASE